MKIAFLLLVTLTAFTVNVNPPTSARITRSEMMAIYHAGWIDGRMAQTSKQYFHTDISNRWKRDSINFTYALDSTYLQTQKPR